MDVPAVSATQVPDDVVMVDVREQNEWDAGRAPGAMHIPLGELPFRLDELPDTDLQPLAIVCRSGQRSARAVAWLNHQGFDTVNLDGGMRAWDAAGKPMVADTGSPHVI